MSSLENEVCEFVRNYQKLDSTVTPESYLSADIGVHGTLGLYFILDFSKKFDTDFSSMEITRHFTCRRLNIIEILLFLFRQRKPDTLIDLKVNDLIEAAASKKWSDDILKRRLHAESLQTRNS